jgi:hypothetical protein
MKKFKLNLEYAVSTWFGLIRTHKTCKKWDKVLNELMDKYEDTAILSSHTIHFGHNEIWIRNRFYAYGSLWKEPHLECVLPKRKTAIRLALIEDRLRLEKEVERQEKYDQILNSIK